MRCPHPFVYFCTQQTRDFGVWVSNGGATKSHLPMFNHSEVIVLKNKQINKQTDKQTDAAENIHLTSLCYVPSSQQQEDLSCDTSWCHQQAVMWPRLKSFLQNVETDTGQH